MPGGYWRHRKSRARIDFEKDAAGGAGRKLFLAGIEQEQIHPARIICFALTGQAGHRPLSFRRHVFAGKDKARAGGIEVEEVCVEPVQRAVGHG